MEDKILFEKVAKLSDELKSEVSDYIDSLVNKNIEAKQRIN